MSTRRPPNILLLYSDQHSARVLGCYGNDEVYTPNLDKLAEQGVRLEHAYTQNPICTPSRMCLMSGQYAHNFGYYGLMGRKPEQLPHLFFHMKKYGYTTGMAGKIHTPAGWLSEYCDYVRDGYGHDKQITQDNSHLEEGAQGTSDDDYSKFLKQKGLLERREDKIIPEWKSKHGLTNGQGLDSRPSELTEDETIEAWTAACTNEFIEDAHSQGKPFCFWMSLPRPHETYTPATKFWDLYETKELTLPLNAESKLEGRHFAARRQQKAQQQDKKWIMYEPGDWDSARRRVLKGYYACVSQVDDAVGRVLAKLDELGVREETIIVYASDHGEFAGEHGLIEKAPGIAFRCVTRIPYIWSWKGQLPEGVTRDSLVESVDFFPTVCSLAGIPLPDWVDGMDISSVLNKGDDVKEIAVTENPITKTVHTKRFKLTQYIPEMCEGKDFGELYDVVNDPWELNNLYFEPEYQTVVNELRYKLYCWMVRTSRPATVNPKAPSIDWDFVKRRPWELADDLYSEDKRLSFPFIQQMIANGWINYL